MNNRLYTIQEAASILGVSTKTLRRWDQRGRLVATRTAGNQRRYTQTQIDKFRSSTKSAAPAFNAPPLFSENEVPKEIKVTHSLPSALSGLPSGSILRNHFLLKHPSASSGQAESVESNTSLEPASFTGSHLAKLNPFKIGLIVASLVLILSLAGAFVLTKYNVVAGLSEKRDQFAKFIDNLPQISLQIGRKDLNQDLSFVPQDIVGSVLAAAAGGSDLALNINIPTFFSQNVGIGTATPDTSAILDLVSEDKGFLAPRMTAVQRDAIPTPAAGLFVYNTDTNQYNMYDGTSWKAVGGVTAIGDVTTGEAFTETGTSGTALYFYDADGRGKLTTANLTGVRTYTLPDATGEVSLLGQTISNAELVNSKVTVSPGTNMTGGGEVALGSSITLTLKDSISLAGTLTTAGTTTLNGIVNIGDGGDNVVINSDVWDITAAGAASGLTGLSSSGTIAFSGLTASRALFTDTSSNLTTTAASSALLNALTDETGTGVAVFGTSPAITTSLTTGSTSFDLLNTTATTVNFAGAATTLSIGATTGTATINNATTAITGALTANGDVTLGNAITDNITFTGRVAQDSDLIPITATGTNDLGSTTLPWDNVYANNVFAASSGISGYWQRNSQALSPTNITDDLLLGATSTSSAKFGFINIAGGTPTATISSNLSLVVPTGNGPASTLNLLNNGSLNIQKSIGGDAGVATVLYIQNSGNVGIGNTAPGAMLSVGSSTPALVSSAGLLTVANTTDSTSGTTGSINTLGGVGITKSLWVGGSANSAQIFSALGTVLLPGYSFQSSGTSDPNTGMWSSGADTVNFSTGGTEALRIDSSQRVGIGNTTPLTALDVTGSASLSANLSLRGSGTAHTFNILDNGSLNIQKSIGGDGGVATVLFIENSGNIGVGDSSPSSRFEVGDGTDSIQISSVGDITFVDANGAASITGPAGGAFSVLAGASQALTLTGNAASTWSLTSGALGINTTSANIALSTTTSGDITLTTGGTTGLANILTGNLKVGNGTPTITQDGEDTYLEGVLEVDGTSTFGGNVGIGITTPLTALDVTGSASLSANLSLRGSGTAHTFNILDNGSLNIQKSIGGDAGVATVMYLQNSGNVGIGNTAPSALLAVGSTSQFQVSTAGAVTAVGVNSGSGLIQGTGGITVTGTGNINATGTSATNIGNSTGALVLASGGTSSWTNTSGNLTISTATSGTLSLDSAGALNVGPTNATSLGIGRSGVTTTINGTLNTTSPQITTSLTTDSTTFALVNATATTVNFAGAATTLTIGGTTGTASIRNTTVNFPNATLVGIGNTAPLTALDVTGSASLSANLSLRGSGTAHTFNILDNGSLNFRKSIGGDASMTNVLYLENSGNVGIGNTAPGAMLSVGSSTPALVSSGGLITVANTTDSTSGSTGSINTLGGLGVTKDLAVDGGDIVTAATTFNLINATATTVNFAGAATTLTIGGTTGTASIRNTTVNFPNATLVGIGNTAPLTALDVTGSASLSANLSLRGSGTAHTFNILDNGSLNIQKSIGGDGGVATVMYLQNSGNVGIGTTSPSSLFNVNGTLTATTINAFTLGGTIAGGGNQLNNIIIGTSTPLAGTFTTIQANTGIAPDADDGAYLGQSGTGFSDLFLASGAVINFNAGDVTLTHAANVLGIEGGNVGIGNTAPLTALDVTGSASLSANLSLRGSGTAHTFNILDNGSLNIQKSIGGDAGVATALYIQNSGNVGIGTTSPSRALEINKGSTGGTIIYVNNPTAGTGNFAQLTVVSDTVNVGVNALSSTWTTAGQNVQSGGTLDVDGSGGLSIAATNASGIIRFYTGGTSEKIRFDAGGNVGIGTTTPAGRLDVDGAAAAVTAVTQRAIINNTNAITTNTGATAVYGLTIDEPNITVGTATPTTSASLYISGAATEATTNYGIQLGAMSGATSTGLDIGALSGTTANKGINIGAISGTGATGAGITIGNISTTGATNYGINLGTMTGGTTSNYQINTGVLTSATTTTNAQLNLGGIVTTGGTTNYGINVGALSGTGTTNYGVNVNTLTSTGTTNYGLNIGGATGAATTNYGILIGAVSGATTNYGLYTTSGTTVLNATSGNVGIGNTTPLTALDVTGSASLSANLSLRGSGTAHTFNILDNGSLNIQKSIGGDAGVATVMYLQNSGNVGIGTTSPGSRLTLADDLIIGLGTDSDIALLNRSTTLAADTTLTNVLEGTVESQAIAANSLMIANQTNDGDLAMYVSKAGNSQQVFFADGSTGDTAIMASSGQSVDIYIAGTKEIDYATGAMAFQQATTISTTTGNITIAPAGATAITGDLDVSASGAFGNGASIDSSITLNVTQTSSNPGAYRAGIAVDMGVSETVSTNSQTIYGLLGASRILAANSKDWSTTLRGIEGRVFIRGSSTPAATITGAAGLYGLVINDTGNAVLTNAYGAYLQNASGGGGGITNNYGLYIENQTTGATSDYGIYIAGADTNAIWVDAGTSRFDGNVGLGGQATPLTELDVTGSASLSANLSLRGSGTAHTFNILDNGSLNIQKSIGGDAGVETVLYIQNSGNVGIGTTGPTSTQGWATIVDLDAVADGGYRLHGSGAQESGIATNGAGFYIDVSGATTSSDNVIIFRTEETNSQFTPTERMRVTGAGNVGIGNTAPLTALDVTGSASLSANISLRGSGTAHTFNILDNGSLNIQKSIGGDAGVATVLYIQNTGYVGIGTTSPGLKLDVQGTAGTDYARFVKGIVGSSGSGVLSMYGDLESNNGMYLADTGNLGIGPSSPLFGLDLQKSQTATAAAQIFNTGTGTDDDGLIIKLGNTSATVVSATNHFISFETAGIGIVGSVQGSGGKGVTYATSGIADFAEYFKKDSDQPIPFGSVVCLKDNGLAAPCDSNNGKIIGIASERPAFLGGENLGDRSIPVGLVGQVRTRVSTANGAIKIGDPLTSSSIPGVAVKATSVGQILGKALEGFDPSAGSGQEGEILASVNITWYNPSVYVSYDGTLAGMSATVSSIGDQLTLQGAALASQGETASNAAAALQAQIASNATAVASVSASLAAKTDYVLENDPLFDSLNNKVADLQSKLDLLSLQFDQQASISGLLTQIQSGQVLGASTSAKLDLALGDLELNNATIAEDLMVLGRTTVTDLGVTGNINAGMLAIHGLNGEINTLSGDLYLQKVGLGGVNILAGKVTIDTSGNMTVAGTITAKAIEAENYTVLGQESIGSGTIPAGLTSIEVTTQVASSSSKIFLTATSLTDKQLTVVEKENGKFKVAIPAPTTSPISFDWWIVGNK